MTLRQADGPWSWDDRTDVCVASAFAEWKERGLSGDPRAIIEWCVSAAMKKLGNSANLDMIGAAVADHLNRNGLSRGNGEDAMK